MVRFDRINAYAYMDLVYFTYGLAFVLMAVAIFVTRNPSSAYTLAGDLQVLASFALLHGLLEWVVLWGMLHGETTELQFAINALTLVSFLLLLEFGRRMLLGVEMLGSAPLPFHSVCAPWLVYGAVAVIIGTALIWIGARSADFQIFVRYCICFPACLMASFGLWQYFRITLARTTPRTCKSGIKAPIHTLSGALFAYGVLAGLVAPASDWFPASVMNQETFNALLGVPVQVARTLCAVLMAWSTVSLLRLFKAEQEQALREALDAAQTGQRAIQAERDLLLLNQSLVIEAEVARAEVKVKSDLLSHVSHEIRNPLNGVLGLTEQLQKSGLQAEQQRLLASIQKASLSMSELLNDTLDQSKLDAGKIEMEQIPTAVREVATQVVALAEAAANKGRVSLTLHISDGVPEWIQSDPLRLQQIMLNLLSNAVKFGRRDGEDSGRVGFAIERSRREDGSDGISIQVSDNGPGMEASTLDALFKPFEQGPMHIARQFGGTGLGLTITHRLVHLMGGEISVQSAPGVGSVFLVQLPLIPANAPQTSAPVARDAIPTGLAGPEVEAIDRPKVLLVDDNELNQEIFSYQLRLLKYDVAVANNGLEALERLQKESFAILLTDCNMPVMDGFQLTRAIRKHELDTGKRLAIIAITGNAFGDEARRCLDAGMDDYLAKPVQLDDLGRVLTKWRFPLAQR